MNSLTSDMNQALSDLPDLERDQPPVPSIPIFPPPYKSRKIGTVFDGYRLRTDDRSPEEYAQYLEDL